MTDHGRQGVRGRPLREPGSGPVDDERADEQTVELRWGGRGEARSSRYYESRSHQPLRAQWDPTGRDSHPRDENRSRPPRPERRTKKQSWLGRFVRAYGWRAYAIPVLLVVTVLVVIDAFQGSDGNSGGSDTPGFGTLSHTTGGTGVIGVPPKGDGNYAKSIPTGALPDGGPFTVSGPGTWHTVPGTTGQIGQGTERVFTYSVDVEDGMDTSSFGGDESFARMVEQTLANPKSWTKDPRFGFRRVDQGDADFRVSLTSQMTTRQACGYDIPLDTSCYNPAIDRVILNEARWVRGAVAFQGDIGSYRQYQVNHEVGHAIGYAQHQPCETNDGLAPVMMQQTFGTANNDIAKLDPEGVVPMDGKVCHFNPWPFPRG